MAKTNLKLAARIRGYLGRLFRGIAWRIRYRYKPLAKLVFLRVSRRRPYRRLPVRLNARQRLIVETIARHPSYGNSVRKGPRASDTISAVIPHYNQQAVLGETIDSILSQTVKPLEVIVVDDSSTDRDSTRRVMSRYASDPSVKILFPEEKLYLGGARNYGADRADGDVVIFMDSDDIAHPQRAELMRRLFREKEDAAFIITGTIPFTDSPPIPEAYSNEDFDRAIIGPGDLLDGLAGNFARSRLNWIDASTGKVPWYAWGAYGLHRKFQPHSGAVAVRKEDWGFWRYGTPKEHLFTPYEDFEYSLFMQALSRGGYQIDLPLLFYRRGYTTSKPMEAAADRA